MARYFIGVGGTGQITSVVLNSLLTYVENEEFNYTLIDFESIGSFIPTTILSPIKSANPLKLQNYLNPSHNPEINKTLELLIPKDAIMINVNEGMFGYPMVGSSILPMCFEETVNPALNKIRPDRAAEVFIVGSIVGGTGAGIIPPLIKELKTISGVKIYLIILLKHFEILAKETEETSDNDEARPISTKVLEWNEASGLFYMFDKLSDLVDSICILGYPDYQETTKKRLKMPKRDQLKIEEQKYDPSYFHVIASLDIIRIALNKKNVAPKIYSYDVREDLSNIDSILKGTQKTNRLRKEIKKASKYLKKIDKDMFEKIQIVQEEFPWFSTPLLPKTGMKGE